MSIKKIVITLGFILVWVNSAYAQYDTVKTYYSNGTLKELLPRYQGRLEGTGKSYDSTGVLREERVYIAGKVEGLVRRYSSAGKLSEQFSIEAGKREGPATRFDESGKVVQELFFANGRIETPDTTTFVPPAQDEDQILPPPVLSEAKSKPVILQDTVKTVSAIAAAQQNKTPQVSHAVIDTLAARLAADTIVVDYSIQNNSLVLRLNQAPEPVNGWVAFRQKVVYPEYAKKKNITGRVLIQAVIDKRGEVNSTAILKGIGYGCDESAEITVYYTKYLPAIAQGQKKYSKVIIPIDFGTK
ncbi:MAG: TonB family protein [Ignavibacteria bacterium]|nr:TonB family protein [Ignavibacteria bacterium]